MNILIINGSIRQSQATKRVTAWVEKTAKKSLTDVEVSVIDLYELALPLFDEAVLPMMNKDRVSEGSVKIWLDALQSADAYVFVTPEYNHGMPSGLKNAIDYINFQIMNKPFTVVSHGANGGARSAEQLKLVLNANIGGVPIPATVTLNGMIGFGDMISEAGDINAESLQSERKSLEKTLDRLVWYGEALATKQAQ